MEEIESRADIPASQWSIGNGHAGKPDAPLVRDILYAYDHFEPAAKREAIIGDLAIYAVRLCQPNLFDDPAHKEIKRTLSEDIRQASKDTHTQDIALLLPKLKQIASGNGIESLPPLSAIEDFPIDENQKSRLRAVLYYVALQQADIKIF